METDRLGGLLSTPCAAAVCLGLVVATFRTLLRGLRLSPVGAVASRVSAPGRSKCLWQKGPSRTRNGKRAGQRLLPDERNFLPPKHRAPRNFGRVIGLVAWPLRKFRRVAPRAREGRPPRPPCNSYDAGLRGSLPPIYVGPM